MTAQTPERLEVEHPRFDPGAWKLFAVIRGEPTDANYGWGSAERATRFDPGAHQPNWSANAKGYTEEYRVTPEGRVVLERVTYDDGTGDSLVREQLDGDFYLVLKSSFEGPRLYVPFRDGAWVEDHARWRHEAYTSNSPAATELRAGAHPDFPGAARLWWESCPPSRG